MSLVSALVDNREPPSIRAMQLPGVSISVAMLDAGDFLGIRDDNDCYLVERKAVPDLLSSIADNRLLDQASRMTAFTKWAYLVITGLFVPDATGRLLLEGRSTNWDWASLQGALLSVQELGVAVVYALSDADYPATLLRLANRSHAGVRIAPRRVAAPLTAGEVILTALPGIGDHHARQLLDYCISPAWALTYISGDNPMNKVPGIGMGIRQRVRSALGLQEDEYLSVMMFDSAEIPLTRVEKMEKTA